MPRLSTVAVAIGGALGSVLRFWVSAWLGRTGGAFPWGTLVVNASGSLLLGLLTGLISQAGRSPTGWTALLTVGFCGGYTTFSAFSLQTLELLRGSRWAAAAGNAAGSVLLCVSCAAAGLLLGHWIGGDSTQPPR